MKKTKKSVKREIHYVMGIAFPKTDFTKLLSIEHIRATQEFDHRRARLLEKFIKELGGLYEDSESQKNKHSYLKMAADQMYDLEQKIGMEFHKPSPPLFMSVTHGYILAELCEIRGLMNCSINCADKESSGDTNDG